MEVKHRCNQVLELGFPLGGLAKLFAQEWEGDVTVVMPATLAQVFDPKPEILNFLILESEILDLLGFLLGCGFCVVLEDYTKPDSCRASESG